MAVIHQTTLKPTKVELLSGWLPSRTWYQGGAGAPALTKSGGFRLDDPEGEVGIEFMVVTDAAAPEPVSYLVPLTYRGAPLAGAEHALIGTMEHGILGTRWVYDGCHDPVLVAQLLSLIEGKAPAMAQSISDTPDHQVVRSYTGAPFVLDAFAPEPADDRHDTRLPTPCGTVLRLHRVLRPVPGRTPSAAEHPTDTMNTTGATNASGVIGQVAHTWQTPDGAQAAAVFMTVHAA